MPFSSANGWAIASITAFACVVGPDHEVGVATGGGGHGRLGGGRGLGACGLRAGWLSAGRDGGGPGGAGRAEHSSCREE